MSEVENPSQQQMRDKRVVGVYLKMLGLLAFGLLLFALLLPSPGSRRPSKRSVSRNNLKQHGLAFHNYHDANKSLPVDSVQHSWITSLLPYLDQDPLYHSIDQTKPWDNPVNVPHMQTEIEVLLYPGLTPRTDTSGNGLAHYAANSKWLVPGTKPDFPSATDGLSNTLLMGEIGDGFPPWGRPGNERDPSLGFNGGPMTFGHPRGDGVQFLFGDGHVQYISSAVDPAILEALATPAGGDKVPAGGW